MAESSGLSGHGASCEAKRSVLAHSHSPGRLAVPCRYDETHLYPTVVTHSGRHMGSARSLS